MTRFSDVSHADFIYTVTEGKTLQYVSAKILVRLNTNGQNNIGSMLLKISSQYTRDVSLVTARYRLADWDCLRFPQGTMDYNDNSNRTPGTHS